MNKTKLFAAFVFIAAAVVSAYSESSNLFRIERNKNANIVVYDAVLSADGTIDKKKPVDAYWILNAKDGQRYELGTFDKKAYGYKTELKDGFFILTLKAVPDRPIKIIIDKGKAKGEITINNAPAYLEKVYVFATDAFIPSVIYYTLTGSDIKTGAQVEEKIDNKKDKK